MLGVSAAVLILVPLAYMIIKRIPPLKRAVTSRVSIRILLAWHIYAGVLGPILAILHTAHKFESPLGIALTMMMLVVVLSGFTGRYLMSRFSESIRDKKKMLTELESAYRATAAELAAHREEVAVMRPFTGFLTRVVGSVFVDSGDTDSDAMPASVRALRLSESIADVEYAIRTHEDFKRAFGVWLKFHIVISLVLYVLLGLHIWSALHFGLRWFA